MEMVFASLVSAIKAYVKMPIVWINGILAALFVLASNYVSLTFGNIAGFAVIAIYCLIAPFFLGGTYGVLIDNNKRKGAFWIYARYGFKKCLFPNIFVALITWLLMNVLTTVLTILGMPAELTLYISVFVVIPIIFFCYFADITAVRHNLTTGQAIKDSAKRIAFGSFSITGFYLMNIAIAIFASFVMSIIMTVVGYDALLPITEMTEDMLLAMSPDEIIATVLTPEIIRAAEISLAITLLIFVPLFVSYKTYFFKKMLSMNQGLKFGQPARGSEKMDGEYDAKGRWFKYT